jgi:hypothetical protein
MSRIAATIESVSRRELVERLRIVLRQFADEETSICKAAAERGIFCRGFSRYTEGELQHRYEWIMRKRPGMTRDELEQIANYWQLAQQQVHGIGFACDVQTRLHDTCGGWDDFTNGELVGFYTELTGRKVEIHDVQ